MNKREKRTADIKKAMPEIKNLYVLYGASVVIACVNRIKAAAKARKKLDVMRHEVSELEKRTEI